jgi:hypothetical protein
MIPFCFLVFFSKGTYQRLLKIRFFYVLNRRVLRYRSNKVLFNILLLLLKEEQYKMYKGLDFEIFVKQYNFY